MVFGSDGEKVEHHVDQIPGFCRPSGRTHYLKTKYGVRPFFIVHGQGGKNFEKSRNHNGKRQRPARSQQGCRASEGI